MWVTPHRHLSWREFFLHNLDSTCLDHLLAEIVLVLSNTAIPSADGLVFTHHNILGNLVQKSVI